MPCDTPSKTSNQVASLLAGPCRKPLELKGPGLRMWRLGNELGKFWRGAPQSGIKATVSPSIEGWLRFMVHGSTPGRGERLLALV